MRTIAIGLLALALTGGVASAQTADEKARIIRDFEQSVVDYTTRHKCLDLFPEAVNATTPAPRIFTLPVAVVFRQEIARALAERDGIVAINGDAFPRVLQDALPPLPAPLEYRLIGHDLIVRDKEADFTVGVLREAVGSSLTVTR
jgi:hypothetical protein